MRSLSPRMTLTLWYVLIVTVVAVLFASFIFRVTTANISHHSLAMQTRIRTSFNRPRLPEELLELIEEDQHEAEQLLFIRLAIITSGIIFSASLASYYLAGKSLQPLENTLEMQKQFVADTSHELKTPIAALRTHLEVSLKDTHGASNQKQILQEALDTVVDMQMMVQRMLESSDQNEKIRNVESCQLLPMLKKITQIVSQQYPDKKISFSLKGESAVLLADASQMQQLFTSLIDNAVKHSKAEQKVTIMVKQSKGEIMVSIKDEGAGISEEDLPHVFDRFYRANSARTRSKNSGQGLGLSIAKRIVEDYHGYIKIKSSKGKGTKVKVIFPL